MTGILVLGKNGQVGHELTGVLGGAANVTALDRSELDLANRDAIVTTLRALKPAIVINAAAYTAVDAAETDAAAAMAVNRDAPGLIAQELKGWGGALIHYSTDYIFDGRKFSPYTEDEQPSPLGVYGRSKLEGERAIAASGCAYLILRTSWVYGAGGNNFCRTVWRLVRTQNELRIVHYQTGSPTWAKTIADVTRALIEKCGEQIREARDIVHVAGAGAVSRDVFAAEILRLLSRRFGETAAKAKRVVPVSSDEFRTPAVRPPYSALSTDKLHTKFGIELRPWQDDLAEFAATSPENVWQ